MLVIPLGKRMPPEPMSVAADHTLELFQHLGVAFDAHTQEILQ